MKSLSNIEKIVGIIFGAWVLVAITLQTYGVFSRNVLNVSTAWIDDIQRLNFIWLIWICAALAFAGRGLISLDLVQSKLAKQPKKYHLLNVSLRVLELLFAVAFVYLSFAMLSTQIQTGQVTPAIEWPLWILTLGFFIGCLLFLGFSIYKLVLAIKDYKENKPVNIETDLDALTEQM